MKIVGIIPARFESVRFPGKPLVSIGDRSMVARVFDQASRSKLDQVWVATDDGRIVDHCNKHDIPVVLTSKMHPSGTDRVAEAASGISCDIIVNVQGDEPFLPPEYINRLIEVFENPKCSIATLAAPLHAEDRIKSPNTVKVVKRRDGRALYFSRAPIPYVRQSVEGLIYRQHMGVYAFRRSTLLELSQLPPDQLESCESLEQLRWLEAGYDIQVVSVPEATLGIDTPEDLEALLHKMKEEGSGS